MRKTALLVLVVLFLTSCGATMHYSPLDQYIEATNYSIEQNAKAKHEAQHFIDSINHK